MQNYNEKKEEIYFNKNDFFENQRDQKTRNTNKNYFTYSKLYEINHKETNEMIKSLLENTNLSSSFSQTKFSDDMIYLMIEI